MDNPSCPVCPGVGRYLGVLGQVEHFRCVSCGWDFHAEPEQFEDDAPESAGGYDDSPESIYGDELRSNPYA